MNDIETDELIESIAQAAMERLKSEKQTQRLADTVAKRIVRFQAEEKARITNEQPIVSMVVGSYNKPEVTVATIHCLLIQTIQNVEILVVNDGPNSRMRKAVEAIDDPRVRFYETDRQQNDWGNTSKEFGSQIAKGQYIGHSNDDNYYAPLYFDALIQPMIANNAQFAYCDMVHSHSSYAAFHTAPVTGRIDGGGWLCRADIVKSTPWPGPKRDSLADGRYVEALVAKCENIVKVPAFLFVHN